MNEITRCIEEANRQLHKCHTKTPEEKEDQDGEP